MRLGGDTLGVEALAASVLRTPPVPTITSPIGTVTTSTIEVTWTYSSPIGRAQTHYRVVLQNQAGSELFDTGKLAGTATSYALGYVLSPFAAYRLLVGVSDGLDGADDPVLLSSGWTYADFTTQDVGSDAEDLLSVGKIYEIGLNGVGYMLADHPDQQFRYQRQTVQLTPERLATGSTPFSEAIDRYNFIVQSDWTGGAGQTYLDRANSDPTRYSHSEWVNPFEQGELFCLATPELHIASTYQSGAECRTAVVAGGDVYVQTADEELTALDEPGGVAVPFDTGLATAILGLASDGTYWYASDGASIRRNNTAADPGSDWSTDNCSEIEWVGDRLAGFDNVAAPVEFLHFSPAGAETVEATYTDATLKGLTGGDGFVWFGVNRSGTGVVNAWQLDSPDAPFIGLSLPAGETVDSLFFYLGNVFIASETEDDRFRIYRCVPSEGRLTPQFLLETNSTGQSYPIQWAGRDRFVAFAWNTMNRGGSSGLGVIDLESGGFARWYAAGGGGALGKPISGVVRWQGDFGFVVSAGNQGGFYGVDLTPELHEGFAETSVSDLATNVVKVLDTVALSTQPLNGSVEVFYSTDSNGTFVSIGSMSGSGSTLTDFQAEIPGSSFGFKVTLTPDSSEGPVVKLLSAKVHPLGLKDQVVVLPVDCTDERVSLTGKLTPDSGRGRGREIARTMDSLVGTNVLLQDVDWPDEPSSTYQVVSCELAEKGAAYSRHETKRKAHAVAMVTLRKPVG